MSGSPKHLSLMYTLILCIAGIVITTPSSVSTIDSVTTCNCLGQIVTLQCTAIGGAFTVWAGSAFMCQGGEISLTHVRFLDSIGACNDGAIIAQGVSLHDNHYTSHLNVTLSSELVGRTVSCSLDDGTQLTSIGSIILALNTINTFPPPSEVYLLDIEPNQITFGWSIISHDGCLSFSYIINSTNCGICSPVITTSNTSTCRKFSSTLLSGANHVCNFSVRSIICGNITGDLTFTSINLKVPDIPIVQSVAYYDSRASLIQLDITIFAVDSFNISGDPRIIDGSATSYTIIYAESTSRRRCHSVTIMASSCEDGMCKHVFDISSSLCPPSVDITVSVFASNILGNSSNSTPFNHDGVNNFVEVDFHSSTQSVQCLFLTDSLTDNEKYCIVNVTYGNNCDQHVGIYHGQGTSNSVETPLQLDGDASEYCLFVNATNNNTTVIVEERLNPFNIGGDTDITVIVGVPIGVIGLITVTAVIVILNIMAVVIYYIHKKRKHTVVLRTLSIVADNTENAKHNKYFVERCQAVQELKETSWHPYPHKFPITHTLKEFHSKFSELPPGELLESEIVSLAGRIHTKEMASNMLIVFYDIQHIDETKVQIIADASYHNNEMSFEKMHQNIRMGDIVGVKGFPKKTEKGELSVFSTEIKLLSPCLHMFLKQQFGLDNQESRYKQRYLDMIVNGSVQQKFQTRAKIISFIRKFLDNEEFLEVETPMMNMVTGGAAAKPFATYHNELKRKVYLRVAPEHYHKMLMVGGLERIYEMGRVFRNEAIDPNHNPEFTTCEFCMVHADYDDLMKLTEKLLSGMVVEIKGGLNFDYTIIEEDGQHCTVTVDFTPPFRRIRVIPKLEEHLKEKFPPSTEFTSKKFKKFLEEICIKHKIECAKPRTSARMLDKLIDHFIVEECIGPTFVTDHPQIMSPLAKWHRSDKGLCERFELFVCRQEICNAYTGLNDPIKLREMFQLQDKDRKAGDSEAQKTDEDLCRALEYGLPPFAGTGIGIDRMAMLLTNSSNIKEVVFFPAMKPTEIERKETPVQQTNNNNENNIIELENAHAHEAEDVI